MLFTTKARGQLRTLSLIVGTIRSGMSTRPSRFFAKSDILKKVWKRRLKSYRKRPRATFIQLRFRLPPKKFFHTFR
jgi:hypothetical protein